jgi:DNA polymerase-3 subunit beta
MHIEVERADLLKAMSRVYRVVERRSTIPILGNVHLSIDGTMLVLRTTDLDIEVRDDSPTKLVHSEGACTVSAHMLYDIVKRLPEKAGVKILMDDKTLRIEAGKAKFVLNTIPAEDFPKMDMPQTNVSFVLPSAVLKDMVDRTHFAISTEETRYYLNGIYFHVDNEKMHAVATDGHRLAHTTIDLPEGSEGMPGIIIPRKTVTELQKLLAETDQEATVEVSDTKIRITVGRFVMLSKLIDGTFPDYERVIPKLNDKVLVVGHTAFEKAIDRVSTMGSDRGRAMKLSLQKGNVFLDVSNPDSGTAKDEVDGEYESEPLEIGFNSRYLLDILGQMDTDAVEGAFADPASPALFRDKGNVDTVYVLMPMRV